MEKMKKSVKAIIVSAVSVVCVLAIVLGLVFGLKKSKSNSQNYKMTAAQKELANQINNSVDEYDYMITGVPYTEYVTSASELSRIGLNYFAFKTGSKERFFTYREKSDGTYETDELTEELSYNFIQPLAVSSKVAAINDKYVLFVSYFDVLMHSSESTKLYYSLVDYSTYGEPVEIFSFDSRNVNINIPQGSFVLEDNYFKFAYLTSIDNTLGTADYNFYAYPYSESKIDYSNPTSKNFVSGIKYNIDTIDITHFDSSFVIYSEDVYKIFYLKDIGFEMFEKEIVSENGYILKDYNIEQIFDDMLFITEVNHISNTNEITKNSVVTASNGETNSYVNYSYKIYDFSKEIPTETPLTVENGYAAAYFQENQEILDNYFYIAYESVDADNELTGKFLIVYYDKSLNSVIKYNASIKDEKILYAGSETFLTSNRILSVKNGVARDKLVFENNGIKYVSSQIAGEKFIFEDTTTYKQGVMNIDGDTIIDQSKNYISIQNIHDNKCIIEKGLYYYLYDFETKIETIINNYSENTIFINKNMNLYLVSEADKFTIKDYDENSKFSNITKITNNPAKGLSFLEVSTLKNYYPTQLIVIDNNIAVKHNQSNTVSYNNFDISNSFVQSGTSYADPSVYSDDNISLSMQRVENPILIAVFKGSKLASEVSIKLHFFNSYTLTLKNMYLNDEGMNLRCTRTYDGELIDDYFSLSDDGDACYSAKFDYVNYLGYASVKIESITGTYTTHNYTVYFLVPDKTVYDSDINYFHYMTVPVYEYTVLYADAFNSDKVTAPDNSVNTRLLTCHITDWRYTGEEDGRHVAHLPPSKYETTSNKAKGYIGHEMIAAEIGEEFAYHIKLYRNKCYYFAHFEINEITVQVNYNGNGTNVTNTQYVTEEISLSAPNSRTGYTWTGWSLGTTSNPMENITHQYKWYGIESNYTDFTGTTFSIARPAGAADSAVLKLKNLRNDHGKTVYITPTWSANIYEITLDKCGGAGGTDKLYLKYSTEIYLNSGCTNIYAYNTTTSKIDKPEMTGWRFAGYYEQSGGKGSMLIDADGKRLTSFNNTLYSSNATIYAHWTKLEYNVKYDDGNISPNWTTESWGFGEVNSIRLPDEDIRPGYCFDGWEIIGMDTSESDAFCGNSEEDLDVIIDNNGLAIVGAVTHFYNLTKPSGTVTLTSRWAPNIYRVDIDLASGEASADFMGLNPIFHDGSTYYIEPDYDMTFTFMGDFWPTRERYNFIGWDIENMESGVIHTFSGPGAGELTNEDATIKIRDNYVSFKNLRQTDYSTDNQRVKMTAVWQEFTYRLKYDLGSGDLEGAWSGNEDRNIFGVGEENTTYIRISQEFALPAPDIPPIGYKFKEWVPSGDHLNANYSSRKDGSKWIFSELSLVPGAEITMSAAWEPITYKYEFSDGGNSDVDLKNTAGEVKYGVQFSVTIPHRNGYTFVGWELHNLSNDCKHYCSSSTSSDGTEFNTLSGYFETNSITPKNGYFKNLRSTDNMADGMVVEFVPIWDGKDYDMTFYYSTNASLSQSQINTGSNLTSTVTQTVEIGSGFTTLSANAILPTDGYKLVGWVLSVAYNGSSTCTGVISGDLTAYSSKMVSPDTTYVLNTEFIINYMVGSPTESNYKFVNITKFTAYAIYEEVTNMKVRVYYAPNESSYNNIFSYGTSYEEINVRYGRNFTIADSKLGTHGIGYMLSVNYLIGGTINFEESISSYTYNSNTYTLKRGSTTNIPWGLQNTSASDPTNPIFYLYAVYCKPEPEKVLTFAYSSRLGGYVVTGVNTLELSRQKDLYEKCIDFTIPSKYNDGVNGEKNVVAIGAYAFTSFNIQTNIVIPTTVKEIGACAFRGLNLGTGKTVKGGSGVNRIDRYAFDNSSYIPDAITTGTWTYYKRDGSTGTESFSSRSAMLTQLKDATKKQYLWTR